MATEVDRRMIFDGGWLEQRGRALEVHIKTKDLELTSVSEGDIPHYQELYSDPATMKMFTDNEERLSKMDEEAWKNEQMVNISKRIKIWIERWKDGMPFSAFAIRHGKEFVGHIVAGLGDNAGESEVAYIIHSKHWNKGYGSQAVEAVVKKWLPYLQQQKYETSGDDGAKQVVTTITATSRVDNTWSDRILVKNGFVKTGKKEAWGCERTIYQKII